MLARKTTDQFLKKLDTLEYGRVHLTTPDGKVRLFQGRQPGPESSLTLHDWSVVPRLASGGDIAFAEDYRAGLWEASNLQNLLTLAVSNDHVIGRYIFGSKWAQITSRLSYLLRLNTVKGSKRNIQAHYDLGNDFYQLWLDPGMSYSSGLYRNATDTLEQSQDNKYDRILERLDSASGRILEVGCGWGGFIERALSQGDFNIRGITLSEQQHAYAQGRVGHASKVVLEDYRAQTGLYDHIVSIEMFEAVGEEFWPVYFRKLAHLLKKGGKAVVQTITIADDRFETYRQGGDAIRSFIFPGGMLPSPSRFSAEAQKAGLQTTDRFFFGKDYARTLEEWLMRFDAQKSAVTSLGYDDGFIRLWRFYLAACIAGFQTERTNVMQVELSHA